MEFEDLQAIWDTQSDKPAFSMKDPRLLLALYQQREQSRHRVFRTEYAPFYRVALGMLAFAAFMFVAFFAKSIYIKTHPRDFPMSFWDGTALALAAVAALAIIVPMYLERKQHERTQAVFAPSLREELDRGIAQLDFEVSLKNPSRVRRILGCLCGGVAVLTWEVGRLNGDPAPWGLLGMTAVCVSASVVVSFAGQQTKLKKGLLPRKRALESMRAELVEDDGILRRN